MTENRENWLYSNVSGLYFQHDNFVMRASDGKQYDIQEECELLNKYDIENKKLKQDIEELQNDKLLTELQDKCDKKQKHIVLLEDKIHRMREQIKKLEGLYHYRGYTGGSGDIKKEYYRREKLLKEENNQLKQEYQKLKHRHSLLHDMCCDLECDCSWLRKDVESLEEENEQLKEQNQRLSEQKHIYKQDWKHLCIDKELLDSENEQLKQRCKELRNDLIDHSALIDMLETVKALDIGDMIWNTMGYKTQTEFSDDFAHYKEKAKRKWRE